MKNVVSLIILIFLVSSCKNNETSSKEEMQAHSTEMPENQEIEMPADEATEALEGAVLHEILEYNKMGNLQMGSRINIIENTTLKAGDSINLVVAMNGEKKVKFYRYSSNGKNLIDFYTANKRIHKVEILDASAVPPGMIAPGNNLRELNKIDTSLMPYGNEQESHVTVTYKDVSYLLDARHPIYEPLDLFPSTSITKITFVK
jgi:hypothetical protein